MGPFFISSEGCVRDIPCWHMWLLMPFFNGDFFGSGAISIVNQGAAGM